MNNQECKLSLDTFFHLHTSRRLRIVNRRHAHENLILLTSIVLDRLTRPSDWYEWQHTHLSCARALFLQRSNPATQCIEILRTT